ncbi:MAG: Rieske 2Fe-2S domain-containing protein, partial [Proteobacteria bacterium]|nr:Rieske 2Fe-2S domain-containing protein [Pseudomonadota bacterium]
ESQIPAAGDYVTLDLAGRPLLVMRQADASIAVLYNRCAHKGSKIFTAASGNAGKLLKCPYHAWTYRLDGSSLGVPMRAEYAGTGLADCENGKGLTRVQHVGVYRGFVFVRLSDEGQPFEEYFGAALRWLDNMVDRSPAGRLVVAGGVIRNVIRCNWKMYLENINDTVHAVSTHESAGKAAKAVWAGEPQERELPMTVEQLLPFASGYEYFDRMDAEVYPNGHSSLGVSFSTHSGYQQPEGYEAALAQAHGEQRAHEVLHTSPQNSVLYPSIAIKGAPLVMRVVRPLAADRTLVEAWSFRAEGAPDLLWERALTYNRLVFSPMSMVAHDDVHLFESIQEGLRAEGNVWVSLHRGLGPDEGSADGTQACKGSSELLMRNQFRAWASHMEAQHA